MVFLWQVAPGGSGAPELGDHHVWECQRLAEAPGDAGLSGAGSASYQNPLRGPGERVSGPQHLHPRHRRALRPSRPTLVRRCRGGGLPGREPDELTWPAPANATLAASAGLSRIRRSCPRWSPSAETARRHGRRRWGALAVSHRDPTISRLAPLGRPRPGWDFPSASLREARRLVERTGSEVRLLKSDVHQTLEAPAGPPSTGARRSGAPMRTVRCERSVGPVAVSVPRRRCPRGVGGAFCLTLRGAEFTCVQWEFPRPGQAGTVHVARPPRCPIVDTTRV
jgi:hypothetical protein